MYTSIFWLILMLMSLSLSGCLASTSLAELKYVDGMKVESLSSNASLSYSTSSQSITGSGYLMYRKPDQIRVTILSPFGSVLQEVFMSGEQITIIDPGNGTAFTGKSSDLPYSGNISGWRYIQWITDIDSPDNQRINSKFERTNRFGQSESAAFENGLLISKKMSSGAVVSYGKYTAVKGVAFPLEIMYETATKEKFNILLEDPEINVDFADNVFTPNLSLLRVYPLDALK